jgi:serine/threonine protein kinase
MSNIKCGAYGCVIRPYIGCEGKEYDKDGNYITKIFSSKSSWKKEVDFNNIIKTIDPKNKFTVKMIDFCDANTEVYKNSEILSFDSKYRDYKKYQIVYEYGGSDLDEFLSSGYILSPNFNIYTFFKSFINIFDGIVELNKNELLHFDVKINNVLYNHKNNKFSLIDFGLMKKKEEVLHANALEHFFINKYYYYPSELNIFSYILFKRNNDIKKESLNISNALYEFKKIYDYIHYYDYNKTLLSVVDILDIIKSIESQLMNYQFFISNFKPIMKKIYSLNLTDTNDISKLLQTDYHTICLSHKNDILFKIDVYMLGVLLFILLLEMIKNFIKHKQYDKINKIPSSLFQLIKKMLIINPCDRIDIKTARTEYKKIIHSFR